MIELPLEWQTGTANEVTESIISHKEPTVHTYEMEQKHDTRDSRDDCISALHNNSSSKTKTFLLADKIIKCGINILYYIHKQYLIRKLMYNINLMCESHDIISIGMLKFRINNRITSKSASATAMYGIG